MPEIAYVNGEFLPLERAMVHVEDRGFQFADAVYEVVRTYHGRPFAMEDHLDRLFRSLEAIELSHDFKREQLAALIEEGIRRAGFAEALIYLQVTRGSARRHRGLPANCPPTIVMTVRELPPPSAKLRQTGIRVITMPDLRWSRCDIKSVALLANVLGYHTAKKAGADDAIFIGQDEAVTEATAGNVFVVSGGRVCTPPKSPRILAGVTREKILMAARAAGIECAEQRITATQLRGADEVFLTSTTTEVLPVVEVDGQQIGAGKPGPVSAGIYEQFVKMFVQH